MGILFLAIGISGCGKTTFGNELLSYDNNLRIVCPDDIRKELNKNISDQSNGREIWKTTDDRIAKYLAAGHDVYLSATNLNVENIKKYVELYSENKVIGLMFQDSTQPSLCKKRVEKDLINQVDRSNTLKIINSSTGENVIDMQHKKFDNLDISSILYLQNFIPIIIPQEAAGKEKRVEVLKNIMKDID